MSDALSVREVVRLTHPVEVVWRAWTDNAWLTGWHPETVTGSIARGQSVRFGWPSLGMDLDLAVEVASPPHRLVLRGGPPTVPDQLLSIDLHDEGSGGGTEVVIEHTGFASDRPGQLERAGTGAGWYTLLRVLDHYLRHHKGEPRSCVSALGPAPTSLERIGELITTSAGLSRWLGSEQPARLDEGTLIDWPTGDGSILCGRVLACRAPFELAVALDDIAGVVLVRGIHMDPATRATLIGVQAWSWRPTLAAWLDLQTSFSAVLQNLIELAGGGYIASG